MSVTDYEPTSAEISAKLREMQAEANSEVTRFTANDARFELLAENATRAREADREEYTREHGQTPEGFVRQKPREPEPSKSDWAEKYEIEKSDDAVVYRRDGEDKIRDHGDRVEVAHDKDAIRDAVSLLKEQGEKQVRVDIADPEKRGDVLLEMHRQDLKLSPKQMRANPELAEEWTKTYIEIQREQAKQKVGTAEGKLIADHAISQAQAKMAAMKDGASKSDSHAQPQPGAEKQHAKAEPEYGE